MKCSNDNSGYRNSGDKNSGDWNSGDGNSGNWNSGNWNSGNWNSGYKNSGYWNSGNWNSGELNSGNWNSGELNSGDCNSGDKNSGNRNSGNRNSGDYNSGDYNSGYFNIGTPKVLIFGKETETKRSDLKFPDYFKFTLNKWISFNNMSVIEKKNNPTAKTTEGYLKKYDYKQAWLNSFNNDCDVKQAKETIQLPNFDYAIFEEITGITKEMLNDKLGVHKCEIKTYFILCPTCGRKI